MKNLVALLLLSIALGCAGCVFSGDDNEPTDEPVIDPGASARLTASADSVVSLMVAQGRNDAAVAPMIDYMESAASLYRQAADQDPSNSRANFGAGVFSFQALLQNDDFNAVKDQLEEWDAVDNRETLSTPEYFAAGTLLDGPWFMIDYSYTYNGHEYHEYWDEYFDPFTAFMILLSTVEQSLSNPNPVIVLQNVIDTSIIPTIDEAIGYIEKAAADDDFVFPLTTQMTGEDDAFELDCGEAHVIAAMLHLARAGFGMMNAYQFSFGAQHVTDYSDEMYLISLVRLQDETDGTFLKLRSTNRLPAVKQHLLTALGHVEDGAAFISAETDNQLDDLIKRQDLTDGNDEVEIEFADDNMPFPVLRNATGIADLAGRIKTMLDGPVTMEVEGHTPSTISINLSAFLANGIPDFKNILPYHEWVDAEEMNSVFSGIGLDYSYFLINNGEPLLYSPRVIDVYRTIGNSPTSYDWFQGTVSTDGVLTLSTILQYPTLQPVSPGILTNDGAIYLDASNRLCMTAAAYQALNSYAASLPMTDPLAMDIARNALSRINFTAEHPFGVRRSDNVFLFAGSFLTGRMNTPPVYLIDTQGNETERTYFPDPTFGGLLPGMTQSQIWSLTEQ